MRSSTRRSWTAAIFAATVLVLVPLLDAEGLTALRSALGRDRLSFGELGSATTIRLLNRLGALRLTAAPDAEFSVPPPARPEVFRRQDPGTLGRPSYRPAAGAGELPSTSLADPAWVARGLPVLSIAVERRRLLRLLAHPQARGRDWEEPANVSYFDGGELRFASPAGLRIHGGGSRKAYRKSFRLYFRDLYGATRFVPGVVSGEDEAAVRQLVVERDLRPDGKKQKWHFINPLAYDVARRLGAVTPRTQPAMLLLNGEPQHVYVLGERIAAGFFERRFGHAAFTLIRGRHEDRTAELEPVWRELQRWTRTTRPLDMARAGERYDLANLTRWYASIVFCATGDAFQAALVRDARRPGGRWMWINWDMDISFRVPRRNPRWGWQKDLFHGAFQGPAGYQDLARGLLHRLLTEDPSYRRYLAEFLVESLNHRLTEDFFAERLAYYEGLLAAYEVSEREFVPELREFFRHRPRVLREQIVEYLAPEGGHTLRLRGAGHGRVAVDGHAVDGHGVAAAYEGWYLDGTRVVLRVAEDARASFRHWRIDGVEREGPDVELLLASDVEVEAVF